MKHFKKRYKKNIFLIKDTQTYTNQQNIVVLQSRHHHHHHSHYYEYNLKLWSLLYEHLHFGCESSWWNRQHGYNKHSINNIVRSVLQPFYSSFVCWNGVVNFLYSAVLCSNVYKMFYELLPNRHCGTY